MERQEKGGGVGKSGEKSVKEISHQGENRRNLEEELGAVRGQEEEEGRDIEDYPRVKWGSSGHSWLCGFKGNPPLADYSLTTQKR